MTAQQNTVKPKWTPKQLLAARCRAIGMTQQASADQVGVNLVTLQRWETQRGFTALREEYMERVVSQVEPTIMANLLLALEVQRQVLNGELTHDSGRAELANRLVARFLDRLLYVEPAPSAGGNPAAAVTVPIQINSNGHHPAT